MQTGFDLNKLQEQAKTRWLKPVEVLYILQNHGRFQMTHKPPQLPPSGALFLFNKRVLRYFRNDGYLWRKKPNGKTVREGHERLKVGGVEAINCYYAHGEQNPCLQRRSYWMLDPGFEHIVLVHYREVFEERCIPESYLSVSNERLPNNSQSISSADVRVQDALSQTTGFNDPGQITSSPGSLEVSSEFIDEQAFLQTDISERNSQSLSLEVNKALRKLKMQLSLNDDDDGDGTYVKEEDGTYFEEKEFLGTFVNEETQDVQVPNLEMRISYEEPINNPLDESKYTLDGHAETGFQCEGMLTGPACSTWFHEDYDLLETLERDTCGVNSCTITPETYKTILPAENGTCSAAFFQDLCLGQHKFDVSSVQESTTTSSQMWRFIIHEISPEWAFSYESTKALYMILYLVADKNFESVLEVSLDTLKRKSAFSMLFLITLMGWAIKQIVNVIQHRRRLFLQNASAGSSMALDLDLFRQQRLGVAFRPDVGSRRNHVMHHRVVATIYMQTLEEEGGCHGVRRRRRRCLGVGSRRNRAMHHRVVATIAMHADKRPRRRRTTKDHTAMATISDARKETDLLLCAAISNSQRCDVCLRARAMADIHTLHDHERGST